MGILLVLFLPIAVACVVLFFPGVISRLYYYALCVLYRTNELNITDYPSSRRSLPQQGAMNAAEYEPDLSVLNCEVQQTIQQEGDSVVDVFSVEICGSIHAPSDKHSAIVRISIQDITEGSASVKPVQAKVKQWQAADSSVFCYNTNLGRLPNDVTTLSNWTSVAKLRLDWLVFARKGRRSLLFNVSILSAQDGWELACSRCSYLYDNPSFGYMDVQDNIKRTKTLAVALAFAVSAADKKIYDCEIELIKKWAKENILDAENRTPDAHKDANSNPEERKLDKALNEVVAFFREGNEFDEYEICREIVEITSIAQRLDILDLCMQVAKANGIVNGGELEILKKMANWLEIDSDKFRTMMEKIIPIEMLEVKDVESILGVTSDMDEERTRAHLNKEYVKWNARVTNTNPEIQSQADQMLKFIAEARTQYVQSNQNEQSESKTLVKQSKTKKDFPI